MRRLFKAVLASLPMCALGGLLALGFMPAAMAERIVAAEYFIDKDPGQGKGSSVAAGDGAFDSSEETAAFSVDVSSLSLGTHTVFLRMKDESGAWGVSRKTTFLVTGERHLTDFEYFIDVDPGPGKGTPIPPPEGSYYRAEEDFTAVIETSGLTPGLHTVYVRAKDSEGNWGIVRGQAMEVRQADIKAAELFFDADPGTGKGIALSAADGRFDSAIEELKGALTTSNLAVGTHQVYARAMTAQYGWGPKSGPVPLDVTGNHAPEMSGPPTGPATGSTGATYDFAASAVDPDNDPVTYRFDWGDGSQSSWGASSQSHAWGGSGSYCVKARARDDKAAESSWSGCLSISISEGPPKADFTASPASGPYPLTVQFTDKSSGNITSWSWGFGDGSSGTTRNPSHTYEKAGSFTVKLTVSGPGGTDTKTVPGCINVTGPPASPDLIISAVSGPVRGVQGRSIQVPNTVKNQGTKNVGGFTVGLYLSEDNKIDPASDILLGSRRRTSLRSGQSSPANTSVKIPRQTAPGDYYIGAFADSKNAVEEADEANNGLATAKKIEIIPPLPDIVISDLFGPVTAKRGGTISVTDSIKNEGESDIKKPFNISLYLSKNGSLDPASDILIGGHGLTSLKVSQSVRKTIQVSIPSDLSPGLYYLIAWADDADDVAELNESNNIKESLSTVQITK